MKSVMTRMSLLIPAKSFFLLAILFAAVGMIGCKGTPIDVAKGRPSDNDIPDDVKSDYDAKEPTGWERLSPENLGKTMKKAVGMGPNQKIGEGLFDEAEKLFADKKYDKAASKFAAAADRWPNSTLEEDSIFLRAESYFFADKYSSANDQYGELLKKYPNTRHLDATTARQFAIARYWQQADERIIVGHWFPILPIALNHCLIPLGTRPMRLTV